MEKHFEVVCMTEFLSKFVSWVVVYGDDSSIDWSEVNNPYFSLNRRILE